MKPSTLLLLTTPALTHSHGIFWSPASRAVLSEQSGYMSDATSIIRCAPLTHSLTHTHTHCPLPSSLLTYTLAHTQLPLNSTTHPLTHSLTHSHSEPMPDVAQDRPYPGGRPFAEPGMSVSNVGPCGMESYDELKTNWNHPEHSWGSVVASYNAGDVIDVEVGCVSE